MTRVWWVLLLFQPLLGSAVNIAKAEDADFEDLDDDPNLGRIQRFGFLDGMALGNPAYAARRIMGTPPEKIPAMLNELSARAILRVSAVLNETARMTVLQALNSTQVMALTRRMSPEEEAELLSLLPGYGVVSLSASLSADQLEEMLMSLPAESLVNLTQRLTPDENYGIMSRLSGGAIVTLLQNMTDVQATTVLRRLPPEGILNITETMTPDQLVELMKSLPAQAVIELVKSLPAESVQNLTMSFSPTQLSELLTHLPPTAVRIINNDLTADQLTTMLIQQLTPADVRLLLRSLPGDAIEELMGRVSQQIVIGIVVTLPVDDLIATLAKLNESTVVNLTSALNPVQVSHLLLSLTFPQLLQLVTTLPSNLTGKLLSEVSASVVLNVTEVIPQSFLGTLFGMLQPEVISSILHKATPEDLVGLLKKIPPAVNDKLIPTLDPGLIEHIMNSIPSDLLISLLGGLSENVTLVVLKNVSNETIANITSRLTPQELVTLLSQLPDRVISSLLTKIPYQLMLSLPTDVIANLTSVLSSTTLTQLLTRLQHYSPQAVVNLTKSLAPESVANILFKLPPSMVENLIKSIPQDDIHELISNMPIDTLLNLTRVLPSNFITNLPIGLVIEIVLKIPIEKLIKFLEELIPGGPLGLLQIIPHDILESLLSSVQPAQIQALLGAIPPGKIQELIGAILPDLLTTITQSGTGDLGKVLGSALHSLLQAAERMDSLQFGRMLYQLGPALRSALPELERELPRLMANFSSFPDMKDLKEALPGLVTAVAENVPLSSFISLLGPLIPEIPRLLAKSIGDLAASVGSHDPAFEDCVLDIELYLLELANGSQWAIDMFDASGKPGRGIQKGNTHMHGNYDQCVDIGTLVRHLTRNDIGHLVPDPAGNERLLKGKYCGVEIGLPPGVLPPVPGKGILPDIVVELYLCLPNTCSGEILTQLTSTVRLPLNITIPRFSCQTDKQMKDDTSAIAAICVLGFLGLLIFIGTVIDIRQRWSSDASGEDGGVYVIQQSCDNKQGSHSDTPADKGMELTAVDVGKGEKQTSFSMSISNGTPSHPATSMDFMPKEERQGTESVLTRAFLSFSLPSNTKKILGVEDASDSVTCLHGIRVLSILWVIVGHTFFFMAFYFENTLGAAEALETVLGQVVINSTLAVDTFFVISGCLTALTFVKESFRQGGVKAKNVFIYFIHRYIRVTPAYAIAIMAFTCLLPYLSDGPNWTRESTEYFQPCRRYWWTSLMYINNFYKDLQQQCVPWGWYLSTDLQFHWLVAPFIIIPFAVGYKIVTSLLIGALVIMQMVLTVYYQYDINGDYLRNRPEFWWKVFEKPYTRVAPFVLGLGLGYILARIKGRLLVSKAGTVVGWLLAITVCFAAVLVKYDENHVMLKEPFHWPEAARSAHEAIYRPFFSIAVCWIILMCATGHGGFINSMLSWKVFVPISHLTFCMYLLHPTVILADIWQTRVPPYFTVGYVLLRASGYIMLSAIFAFFLSVTVEAPIIELARIIFKRSRPTSATASKT